MMMTMLVAGAALGLTPAQERAPRPVAPLAPPVPREAPAGTPVTPDMPLGTLFSYEDYPAAAKALGAEGDVRVRLAVDAEGRAQWCQVLLSSGNVALDQGTCDIFLERARFKPATNPAGEPIGANYSSPTIRWRLMDWSAPSSRGDRLVQFFLSPLGHISGCMTLPPPGREGESRACRGRDMGRARGITVTLDALGKQPVGGYAVWEVRGQPEAVASRVAALEIEADALMMERRERYVLRDGAVVRCESLSSLAVRALGINCPAPASEVPWCADGKGPRAHCNGPIELRALVWRDPGVDLEEMFKLRTVTIEEPPASAR